MATKRVLTQSVTTAGGSEVTATPAISPDTEAYRRIEDRIRQTEQDSQKNIHEMEEKSERKIKDLEQEFRKEISDRETRVIETLAVFVVVLTFVSANISIFSRIDSITTAILFMGGMSVFSILIISFLFLVINRFKIERKLVLGGIVFPLLLIAGYLWFLSGESRFNVPLNPPDDSIQQQLTFQQLEITKLQGK